MAFLDIYPSRSKWLWIPNSSYTRSHLFNIYYGIEEDEEYFLFRNASVSQKKYAVSTHLYRHIYALGSLYVLDISTIVHGMMCYRVYSSYNSNFLYIYHTPKYGFVAVKGIQRFLGYSPVEYKNEDTGKFEGDEFYVISGIDNNKEVTEVSEITLTPRGSWIAENGTTECPGNQTGYMCWCGFMSSSEDKIGKYKKVDTCKSVGASYYPMDDVDDDVIIVGTSCWKNEEHGIEIFYGMSGKVTKNYYGKGFSINNGRIKSVITFDGETREYMSDVTTEYIMPEDDIILFDTNAHEKSITVKFSGYIDSGMEIPLMLGQAAIWI